MFTERENKLYQEYYEFCLKKGILCKTKKDWVTHFREAQSKRRETVALQEKELKDKNGPAWFKKLHEMAHAAGMAAAERRKPTPMRVVQRTDPLDDTSPIVKQYAPVMDGVCGFAWVKMPANTKFAKWAIKEQIFKSSSGEGGCIYWISYFNQSMERKAAYANAYVKVLSDNGIKKVYAQERID